MGVSFFFVLSGFLITYLLIKEKQLTGKVHISSFYIRRTLRIWPLYYFCVLFGFIAFPVLKSAFGQVPNETADPFLCSIFLNNFNAIYNGPPDSSILSVLWSVAIEEQFYLLWPILFYLASPKQYKFIFLGVIIISIIYRRKNTFRTRSKNQWFIYFIYWKTRCKKSVRKYYWTPWYGKFSRPRKLWPII